MTLAIINGLMQTSHETIILMRQNFNFKEAFKVAIGMVYIDDFYGGYYEFN